MDQDGLELLLFLSDGRDPSGRHSEKIETQNPKLNGEFQIMSLFCVTSPTILSPPFEAVTLYHDLNSAKKVDIMHRIDVTI